MEKENKNSHSNATTCHSKKWFVYLVECKDGSLYTGVTNDLDKRMKAHASGKGSKYVYRKGFRALVEQKKCRNRSEACKAEYAIKKLFRHQKRAWFRD